MTGWLCYHSINLKFLQNQLNSRYPVLPELQIYCYHKMHLLPGKANLYLRPVSNVFCTLSNEPDCFHAGIRECSITSKLRQAFDGILKWIDDGKEISFEDTCCKHVTWFRMYYHAKNCWSIKQQESLALASMAPDDSPASSTAATAARRPMCVKWDRNLKPKLAIMRQCTCVTDRWTDRRTGIMA